MIDILDLDLNEAELKVLNDAHPHEIFGVTLLLCTPSTLGRAWTNNDSSAEWQKELDKLPFTDDMKAFAMKFMKSYVGVRPFFKGIADIHAVVYAGGEPHPKVRQAPAIILKLRELDAK